MLLTSCRIVASTKVVDQRHLKIKPKPLIFFDFDCENRLQHYRESLSMLLITICTLSLRSVDPTDWCGEVGARGQRRLTGPALGDIQRALLINHRGKHRGQADHHQNPPELHRWHGILLRDQEEHADDDG